MFFLRIIAMTLLVMSIGVDFPEGNFSPEKTFIKVPPHSTDFSFIVKDDAEDSNDLLTNVHLFHELVFLPIHLLSVNFPLKKWIVQSDCKLHGCVYLLYRQLLI